MLLAIALNSKLCGSTRYSRSTPGSLQTRTWWWRSGSSLKHSIVTRNWFPSWIRILVTSSVIRLTETSLESTTPIRFFLFSRVILTHMLLRPSSPDTGTAYFFGSAVTKSGQPLFHGIVAFYPIESSDPFQSDFATHPLSWMMKSRQVSFLNLSFVLLSKRR